MRALLLRVDLEQALEDGGRLGAVVVEGGAERVAIDPDGRYPLASVRKVVTLGSYALEVASGVCDPAEPVPLREIDGGTGREPTAAPTSGHSAGGLQAGRSDPGGSRASPFENSRWR